MRRVLAAALAAAALSEGHPTFIDCTAVDC